MFPYVYDLCYNAYGKMRFTGYYGYEIKHYRKNYCYELKHYHRFLDTSLLRSSNVFAVVLNMKVI